MATSTIQARISNSEGSWVSANGSVSISNFIFGDWFVMFSASAATNTSVYTIDGSGSVIPIIQGNITASGTYSDSTRTLTIQSNNGCYYKVIRGVK